MSYTFQWRIEPLSECRFALKSPKFGIPSGLVECHLRLMLQWQSCILTKKRVDGGQSTSLKCEVRILPDGLPKSRQLVFSDRDSSDDFHLEGWDDAKTKNVLVLQCTVSGEGVEDGFSVGRTLLSRSLPYTCYIKSGVGSQKLPMISSRCQNMPSVDDRESSRNVGELSTVSNNVPEFPVTCNVPSVQDCETIESSRNVEELSMVELSVTSRNYNSNFDMSFNKSSAMLSMTSNSDDAIFMVSRVNSQMLLLTTNNDEVKLWTRVKWSINDALYLDIRLEAAEDEKERWLRCKCEVSILDPRSCKTVLAQKFTSAEKRSKHIFSWSFSFTEMKLREKIQWTSGQLILSAVFLHRVEELIDSNQNQNLDIEAGKCLERASNV